MCKPSPYLIWDLQKLNKRILNPKKSETSNSSDFFIFLFWAFPLPTSGGGLSALAFWFFRKTKRAQTKLLSLTQLK
jgi:hypothetical protein